MEGFKYRVQGIAIELDSNLDFVKAIKDLWADVCHGAIKLATDGFEFVYGCMEYYEDNTPARYTILVLDEESIASLMADGYSKITAISDVSGSDAADKAWAAVKAVPNRDYCGDVEHFIDNPDGTYTCEVYVSVA